MTNDNSNHIDGNSTHVSLGAAMPDSGAIPVLTETSNFQQSGISVKRCMIESGLSFTGTVTADGTCTIAGHLIGNMHEKASGELQVVISESGEVEGDIFASKVSVMGACQGTVDASGGSVDLHPNSVVKGHIRYGQLQVNGAELNATLERCTEKSRR
ncbi:MAG: polymer-forming cytoskeletal protein [Polaromonas sp.]|nr:polymer-forming cytoskeletal protein [Polaromonas sp.]MBP6156067.1 polymer-forming cytoskeletal protein [Polaromonas sp.]